MDHPAHHAGTRRCGRRHARRAHHPHRSERASRLTRSWSLGRWQQAMSSQCHDRVVQLTRVQAVRPRVRRDPHAGGTRRLNCGQCRSLLVRQVLRHHNPPPCLAEILRRHASARKYVVACALTFHRLVQAARAASFSVATIRRGRPHAHRTAAALAARRLRCVAHEAARSTAFLGVFLIRRGAHAIYYDA